MSQSAQRYSGHGDVFGTVADISEISRQYDCNYTVWYSMLQRCHNSKIHKQKPTYSGCAISDNFKSLTYFLDWAKQQVGHNSRDGEGRKFHLDKDILIKGNKVYSEDTCCFIPGEINVLFGSSRATRGANPVGVYYDKVRENYQAYVRVNGKKCALGRYTTSDEAFYAYKKAKEAHIKDVANKWKEQIDIRVYNALMIWTIEITD